MSNVEANVEPSLADLDAVADKRILKHITYVVLGMMVVAIAIVVTASSIA